MKDFGARLSKYGPFKATGHVDTIHTPALGKVDIRDHVSLYVDNQLGNRCVGQALAGAAWIAARGQGKRVSPHGIYTEARAREVQVARGAPIPDTGCQIADAVDALIGVGIYPYDENDTDPNSINELETWDEVSQRQLVAPQSFAPMENGDIETAQSWLSKLVGVVFAMPVYASYEKVDSYGVWTPDSIDLVGYHAQVLVGHGNTSQDDFIVWNSWSKNWGDGGFAYIPKDWIAANATDMVAVQSFPVFT